jgi:hypothetical protein
MSEPSTIEEPQAEPDAPEQQEPEAEGPAREAAKYRRRLRETEAERDALRERIDSYERKEAEGIASQTGFAVPGDLWTLVTVDDLRNAEGVLDADLVRERAGTILAERPTWKRPTPDLGAGARPPTEEERKPGLADLLGKRR